MADSDMASLRLLVDGYNVLAPVAPPARGLKLGWLQREREKLIERLVRALEQRVRSRTCIVFDAADPPRDRPSRFTVSQLHVWFAVDEPEADDLLEDLISLNSVPKGLAVVSSDNRVRQAASRRGCTVYDSQTWMDNLLEGVVGLADGWHRRSGQGRGVARGREEVDRGEQEDQVDQEDVERWLREFGF